MKEDGSSPVDALFTDVPVRWRSWFKWITLAIIAFGAAMTLLWVFGNRG